jgi:hypothetical protein
MNGIRHYDVRDNNCVRLTAKNIMEFAAST